MAAARVDPLWNAPICGDGPPDRRSAPDPQHDGHCQAACLVCSAASTVAILGDAPSAAIPTAYVIVSPPTALPAAAADAPPPRARARGPPLNA